MTTSQFIEVKSTHYSFEMRLLTNNGWVTLKAIFSCKKQEVGEMINPLVTTLIQWLRTLKAKRKLLK